MMKAVYLDHNATTPLRPEAREALIGAYDTLGGNPSSVHAAGRAARMMLDEARERVAGALGVLEDEILFTSGGTEADNLAVIGGMARCAPGHTLSTTSVEHVAVRSAANQVAGMGHFVHVAPVDGQGRVLVDSLVKGARKGGLVAAMAANSEVGTLTDLANIRARLDEKFGEDDRPLLFTDAVQAIGRVPVSLADWGVDYAAFSAHKVGGPAGVGVLFRKQGRPLEPRQWGGGQEQALRPGTENVAGIVSAAIALELAIKEQPKYTERTVELLGMCWRKIVENIPGAVLNGPPVGDPDRLPNTLNVRLPSAEGQVLVTRLDLLGLQVSAGSACSSGSLEPSPVLKAMGQTDQESRLGLRLSMGRTTTAEEIHSAVEILSKTSPAERNS